MILLRHLDFATILACIYENNSEMYFPSTLEFVNELLNHIVSEYKLKLEEFLKSHYTNITTIFGQG